MKEGIGLKGRPGMSIYIHTQEKERGERRRVNGLLFLTYLPTYLPTYLSTYLRRERRVLGLLMNDDRDDGGNKGLPPPPPPLWHRYKRGRTKRD